MVSFVVKERERKTAVLKPPAFGCLKGVPAVNLTRGCLHRCVYCYARTFPETPQGEVHLYVNLPQRLKRELEIRQRRGSWPEVITFSTASDLFQPHPRILSLAYEVLRVVLVREITVSFLTKGRLSGEVWGLLAEYRSLVKARFGLVSLSPDYQRLFEPFAAPSYLRLRQIERCARLGIEVAARIDPVIPFVTDAPETIDSLLRHLANCGVKEVSVSYLVLRPGVVKQMRRELPPQIWRKILPAYHGQPWQRVITSATTKLARKEIRERGYRLFRELGKRYGLEVRLCGCKNPDLPFESCLPWDTRPASRQKALFD